MADNEHQIGDREPPPIIHAAWEVARSSGMWWPFENAAIMSERPAEIHVSEKSLLHRGDGPAVVFRDGRRAYAWNGKAVPERWIMQPETVPPREYKGFDPTFAKYVTSRIGSAAAKAKTKGRLGRLPFLERYQAGEHELVWQELVALGPGVREDPNAADALAVAYETMRRVDANVRTLVKRLTAMNYVFASTPAAHVPPRAAVSKEIADFEKEMGVLPLSLRAFFEVVGEVNLIGTHPSLDPKGNTVATDPLVVYGFDEGLAEYDDEDEGPSGLTIAPDDLHKANVSGGDAFDTIVRYKR